MQLRNIDMFVLLFYKFAFVIYHNLRFCGRSQLPELQSYLACIVTNRSLKQGDVHICYKKDLNLHCNQASVCITRFTRKFDLQCKL